MRNYFSKYIILIYFGFLSLNSTMGFFLMLKLRSQITTEPYYNQLQCRAQTVFSLNMPYQQTTFQASNSTVDGIKKNSPIEYYRPYKTHPYQFIGKADKMVKGGLKLKYIYQRRKKERLAKKRNKTTDLKQIQTNCISQT